MSLLHRNRWATPYLLLAPGMAWLAIFFLLPMYYLGKTSLEEGLFPLFHFHWVWANFHDAFVAYEPQFVRSFEYAAIATAIALGVSYPLAYWIAMRAGRWKNLFLLLVVAPFFVTYLIRTLAWETILADGSIVTRTLNNLSLLPSHRLLATSAAVIAGITYNFLPFMVLPLYVSLEQIDARLLEAAEDLYASRWRAFLRVTLPLSIPGIVAGTMLTFIPAAGDFINAQLLGTPRQFMIGNVIQSEFFYTRDYPTAAALSFTLMGAIVVAIIVYLRVVGSERSVGV